MKKHRAPRPLSTIEIDEGLSHPRAIIAAMMASAYEAIAQVASGSAWEEDTRLVIAPTEGPHALRMAQIWRHAAEHLQSCEPGLSPGRRRRAADAPVRTAPHGSRRASPAR